jgi:hypothetical protein
MSDTAKLQGPRNASSVSAGGEEYAVEDGIVEVPVEHVAKLASHGFFPYVEPETPKQTKLSLAKKAETE